MRGSGSRARGGAVELSTLQWTVAGVVVAALIGVITVLLTAARPGPDAGNAQSGGQGGIVNGDHSGVTNNNTFNQFRDQAPPGASVADIRAAAASYVNVSPPSGPAPFRVLDTQDIGLKVRSSGEASGDQVGSAADGATVWADCVKATGFDPVLTDEVGATWLWIRWPSDAPGSDFRNSDVGSPAHGWVYAGFTLPEGHNGRIPTC